MPNVFELCHWISLVVETGQSCQYSLYLITKLSRWEIQICKAIKPKRMQSEFCKCTVACRVSLTHPWSQSTFTNHVHIIDKIQNGFLTCFCFYFPPQYFFFCFIQLSTCPSHNSQFKKFPSLMVKPEIYMYLFTQLHIALENFSQIAGRNSHKSNFS